METSDTETAVTQVRFTTSDSLMVKDFYDEAIAERWGHSEARELAFDRAREDGLWHVRRNMRAQLRSALRGHRSVRIADVAFEEFDSGRMHAGAHFAVVLEGPREKVAEFVAVWMGTTAEEFAEGVEAI